MPRNFCLTFRFDNAGLQDAESKAMIPTITLYVATACSSDAVKNGNVPNLCRLCRLCRFCRILARFVSTSGEDAQEDDTCDVYTLPCSYDNNEDGCGDGAKQTTPTLPLDLTVCQLLYEALYHCWSANTFGRRAPSLSSSPENRMQSHTIELCLGRTKAMKMTFTTYVHTSVMSV